ncbi:MAG: glycosyltransferase [Chlorobiaceae bacterium]|nr:glycosyltransferase [Chlorobiaceae bacterium]
MMNLPDIDCILIGVNSAKTLGRCIDSIQKCDYPLEKLHICYVDGGSTDSSIEIARRYGGVAVVALNPEYPTPGMQRNAGWRNGRAPLVQFLDSDTVLDAAWLSKAVAAMADQKLGASLGMRNEMHPESTVYNWIGNIEWNGPAGPSECFGGDVLVRRSALEKTGGYNETLVGGEDPELSRRIIRAGWNIVRLDAPMTMHDLAMTTVKQYLRRAFRSGYGYAAVRALEARAGSQFWRFDLIKIVVKGGAFLGSLLLSLLLLGLAPSAGVRIFAALLPLAGLTVMLTPRLLKVGKFMSGNNLNKAEAKRYAWHCSIVVLPQLFGILRFQLGRLSGKPLRNKRRNLKTDLSTSAN